MKHIVEYCIENQTITSNGVIGKVVIRDIINDISKLGYNKSDIWYSIYKLVELQYVVTDCNNYNLEVGNAIFDVTIAGHKYVSN